jgi:hypothetical protein
MNKMVAMFIEMATQITPPHFAKRPPLATLGGVDACKTAPSERRPATLGGVDACKTAPSGRLLNKLVEINNCIKILTCIYFLVNLIEFRTSKTEL